MLAAFDQPVMTPKCDQRRHTTVATQALWFLNDQEMIEHADALAKSLSASSQDTAEQIEQLFLTLFAMRPTPAESTRCEKWLADQQRAFAAAAPEGNATHHALASLCQVMLASNRFLYID